VIASRNKIDPDLETELLAEIVDAEAAAGGDGEAAMHAIDAAVTSAIGRGVGYREEQGAAAGDDEGEEDGEDDA